MYQMYVVRWDSTECVHQSDDLLRLIDMAKHWLGNECWVSAEIKYVPESNK